MGSHKDIETIKNKLKADLTECDLPLVEKFLHTKSLFLLESKINLLDFALKVAMDDKSYVEKLLASGELVKVTEELIEEFKGLSKDPNKKLFLSVPVMPFVFIQEKK